MKLSEFFSKMIYHDSSVDKVEYLEHDKKLVLHVELCNWMQDTYQESEPEVVQGKLVFSQVTHFSLQPNSIHWNDNEILAVQIEKDTNQNGELLKMVLYDGNDDVSVLEIMCESVEWVVEG